MKNLALSSESRTGLQSLEFQISTTYSSTTWILESTAYYEMPENVIEITVCQHSITQFHERIASEIVYPFPKHRPGSSSV
jgi:hypothetical protein